MSNHAILGREFNLAICKRLGLNPDNVNRIVIDSAHGDVVRVEVTYFENASDADWQNLLKDARFDLVIPDAARRSKLTDDDIMALYDEMMQRKRRAK